MRRLVFMLVTLVAPAHAVAQQVAAQEFTAGAVEVDGHRYLYRLLEPLAHQRDVPRPLVVFLHGAGERGEDNEAQLTWLPRLLAEAPQRERLPCYLLALQCPTNEKWVDVPWGDVEPSRLAAQPTRALEAVLRVVRDLVQRPGVDRARVYLTGLSMGGFGAWELAMRAPHWFAALAPICGGGDPRGAPSLLGLPIQIWHGSVDATVPVQRSQMMASALSDLGAVVDYHELPGVGHDVWRQAYGEGGVLPWLFAQDQRQQQRGPFSVPALVPGADTFVTAAGQFALLGSSGCVAEGAAQAGALLLLDALELPAATRPAMVALAAPRRGDIAFAIDVRLHADFVIDIGDALRVTGRDEAGLRRGAAAAVQALRTLPGHACPAGRLVRSEPGHGGRVCLGDGLTPWPLASLLAAVRLCWLYGADEFEAGSAVVDLPPRDLQRLREEAGRHGVRLVQIGEAASTKGVVFDRLPDLRSVLAEVLPPDASERPFVLRLPPAPPDSSLDQLALQLPAVAERVQRGARSFHVGGFLSRLACQLRPD